MELTTRRQVALFAVAVWPTGKETIKPGAPPILGQVHDAGGGVDRRRLVDEPAHRPEGDRIDQPLRRRRNLEHVTVLAYRTPTLRACRALRAPGGTGDDLLTGQPGSPRRRSAGTVDRGASQAHEIAHDLACDRIDLLSIVCLPSQFGVIGKP